MDSDDVIALPINFVQAILQHDHIAPCLGHVLVAGFDDQHASVDIVMQHHTTEARYQLLEHKETEWLRFMQHGHNGAPGAPTEPAPQPASPPAPQTSNNH